jgi:hypothetical protein
MLKSSIATPNASPARNAVNPASSTNASNDGPAIACACLMTCSKPAYSMTSMSARPRERREWAPTNGFRSMPRSATRRVSGGT